MCVHIYIHISIHSQMYMHMYIYIYSMYIVYQTLYICVNIYILYIYVYTHIYIYISIAIRDSLRSAVQRVRTQYRRKVPYQICQIHNIFTIIGHRFAHPSGPDASSGQNRPSVCMELRSASIWCFLKYAKTNH